MKLFARGIKKATRLSRNSERTIDFLYPNRPEKRPDAITATPYPADKKIKMLLACA
jgi:hypothetical protein